MSFKTPIVCDRRIYDKKGKWKSPNNDIAENIFYFVKEPLTLIPTYERGQQQLKETMTITVYGSKPFAIEDKITTDFGKSYRVAQILEVNYIESNILVKDMLKPRIESTTLVLE
ncbi:MAG: hypothetical protein J6T34_03850 [Bacilli bacterium]|nr:hypothetical protein [Bacilli bacterium]